MIRPTLSRPAATVRASFALYNTRADVDALIAGLRRARRVFLK